MAELLSFPKNMVMVQSSRILSSCGFRRRCMHEAFDGENRRIDPAVILSHFFADMQAT
jgi:hypothetical protein